MKNEFDFRQMRSLCVVACLFGQLLLSSCASEFPEAKADVSWMIENGAIDRKHPGWSKVRSKNRKGYEAGGERFPTLVSREYQSDQSAVEIAKAISDFARDAGWRPGWSLCEQREGRIGFTHPERKDVLLTSRLEPDGDGISFTITGIFDRPGWARTGLESMDCFTAVRERHRMLRDLPPMKSLEPAEIESRLTTNEVSEIFGRPGITSRQHDSRRVQYRDGDQFILIVERIFAKEMPELDGYSREDVYLRQESDRTRTYRVGLGDVSVNVIDHTKSEQAVIDRIAEALKD